MLLTSNLVVNPIKARSFIALFKCTTVARGANVLTGQFKTLYFLEGLRKDSDSYRACLKSHSGISSPLIHSKVSNDLLAESEGPDQNARRYVFARRGPFSKYLSSKAFYRNLDIRYVLFSQYKQFLCSIWFYISIIHHPVTAALKPRGLNK